MDGCQRSFVDCVANDDRPPLSPFAFDEVFAEDGVMITRQAEGSQADRVHNAQLPGENVGCKPDAVNSPMPCMHVHSPRNTLGRNRLTVSHEYLALACMK